MLQVSWIPPIFFNDAVAAEIYVLSLYDIYFLLRPAAP